MPEEHHVFHPDGFCNTAGFHLCTGSSCVDDDGPAWGEGVMEKRFWDPNEWKAVSIDLIFMGSLS